MKKAQSLMVGTFLGAGLTYFLDPRQSGARRARVRDKSVRAAHELGHAASIGARDLEHRIEGVVARVRGSGRHVADGHVLEERVRAVLGRHCSHPSAIEVRAKGNGCIELKGPILASDLHDVLYTVRRVRGVEEIDDDLVVHDAPGDVPALQGEPIERRRVRHVTPAAKLLVALGVSGVGIASFVAGRPLAFVAATAGVLVLARSINARSASLLPERRARRPIGARSAAAAPDSAMPW